jgi:DNA-binding winged helix-turn-helix (wHTH) protein
MDLLAFLASNSGRVVSKDEIIDAVWQGRFIADATLTRSIADLRRALGDDQQPHQYIETIPKRGYRLVARISATGDLVGAATAAVRTNHGTESSARGGRIADRLASARRTHFVGRAA